MSSSSSGGIGFYGLLAIVFITLKLIGYITWSWWWVLAPLWLPTCLGFGILLGVAAAMIVGAFFSFSGISIFENRQKIIDTLKRYGQKIIDTLKKWFLKEKNGNSK
jgi:hypothetical protein